MFAAYLWAMADIEKTVHARTAPEWARSKFAGQCRSCTRSRADQRAFNNRVAKRRKKKGYR